MTLISDNAKTFKAASRDIVRIARSAEVIKFLNSCQVRMLEIYFGEGPLVGRLLGETYKKCQT